MKKMTVKIEQRIVSASVKKPGEEREEIIAPTEVVDSREHYVYEKPMDRPRVLPGRVYKIKPPTHDDALYVAITDHVVKGQQRPFEIFVMSKNMSSFQWMSILTRMLSALMRQPNSEFPLFMIEEMLHTFDPNGGYYGKPWDDRKRSVMYPSVVAEIGHVLRQHCRDLGLLDTQDDDEATNGEVETSSVTREEAEQREMSLPPAGSHYQICGKCGENAVRPMDGCLTCEACGDSKCM